MKAVDAARAGFAGHIIPVIPPGAELSNKSSLSADKLGKIPGLRKRNGTWVGYNWRNDDQTPSPETIDRWGANVGLRADAFPAVDIDVEDPDLVLRIARLVFGATGRTAVRRRENGARLLLPYRAPAEPITKRVLMIEGGGVVEILGVGQQYLIGGVHPSGSRYFWNRESPQPVADELPVLDIEAVVEALVEAGLVEHDSGAAGHREAPDQDSLLAPPDELATLMGLLPNDYESRDDYVRILAALKGAGGTLEQAQAWAAEWEGGNDPRVVEADWDSLTPPYRLGWPHLLAEGVERGFTVAVGAAYGFEDEPEPEPVPEAPDDAAPPLDEAGIVERVAEILRPALRYVPQSKAWYVWEDYRWVPDGDMAAERLIREQLTIMARRCLALAQDASGNRKKSLRALARRYRSRAGIAAIEELLHAALATSMTEFDKDPMILNTPAGPYDLRTGRPAEGAGQEFLRATSVAPSTTQTGERWAGFLNDLIGGDEELLDYLWRVCGYVLTGRMDEKVLWFFWGSATDTGKSTFINIITQVMGAYAQHVPVSVFMSSKWGEDSTYLAYTNGARLLWATEPAAERVWSENHVKSITGNDPLTVRQKYGHPFTYQPEFKVLIVGNAEPRFGRIDDAMIRRVRLVPVNHKVPRERQNPLLADEILEYEGGAVLQWMIEGALAWQQGGLGDPEQVRRVTASYTEDEDLLAEWLEEECDEGAQHWTPSADLFGAWRAWCRSRNESPGKLNGFIRQLRARGFERSRGMAMGVQQRGVNGLRLKLHGDEEE